MGARRFIMKLDESSIPAAKSKLKIFYWIDLITRVVFYGVVLFLVFKFFGHFMFLTSPSTSFCSSCSKFEFTV